MPKNKNASLSRTKRERKQILSLLSELYLFPQSARAIATALKKQWPDIDSAVVRKQFTYLEKKSYVTVSSGDSDSVTAMITASGIDLTEGAIKDRGVLATRQDFSGLAFKRQARRKILSYCAQFPDAYNADDEIHAEFQERLSGRLTLEQVRMAIWYLAGKELVEMKTQPIHGDFIHLARITAYGIDLIEGSEHDPGVLQDD